MSAEQASQGKARALSLSKKMSLEEAFQEIGLGCLAQIQANRAGVAERYDAEQLHQMRVGLRRLRSALRLVRAQVDVPEAIEGDLRWLGEALGAARDWDVFVDSTLPALAAETPQAQALFDAVRQAAQPVAELKHRAAANAVRSPRFKRMMQTLARWFGNGDWHGKAMRSPVKTFAGSALRRDRRRLLKRGEHLEAASTAARHRLRVAAKKARYDIEFFQSLYGKERTRPYLKVLANLQDELGWLNDLAVAERLLPAIPRADGQIDDGVQFTRGYLASRLHAGDATLFKLWKELLPLKLKV